MKKKTLCILLSALILLSAFAILPVGAETQIPEYVFDRAGLLDSEAVIGLTVQIDQLRAGMNCNFFVATHEMKTSYDEYWGEDFLREHGLSKSSNIILLIVTLDRGTYYYDLYTWGDATRKIPHHEVDYILDQPQVYDNIKSGELEAGVSAFLRYSKEAYCGLVGPFYIKLAVISLLFALIVGFAVCASVYRSYTVKKRSVDYPLEQFAKMELTHKEDVFAGSFVTTRVIRSNNGSSGGGFSGSGHGGGGGHRGGR